MLGRPNEASVACAATPCVRYLRVVQAHRVIAVLLAGAGGVAITAVAGAQGNTPGPGTPAPGGVSGTATVITTTTVSSSPGKTTPIPSGPPKASSEQLTHPRVRPRVGGTHSTFALSFTLRQTPGHMGVVATDYRVEVAQPHRAGASCSPPQPAPILSGRKGTVTNLSLHPSLHGWCTGRYRVSVFLQRGPYCPPPVNGKPPTPCPEFATQDLDVGHARFTVR
jgi:hypothetical protein